MNFWECETYHGCTWVPRGEVLAATPKLAAIELVRDMASQSTAAEIGIVWTVRVRVSRISWEDFRLRPRRVIIVDDVEPNTKFSRAADSSGTETTTPPALAETPCSAAENAGEL